MYPEKELNQPDITFKTIFLQDYTTDTYLRQKWTDPRLASEELKVSPR